MRIIIIKLINFYQFLSEFLGVKKTCKFYPSCSEYAIDSVTFYGPVKGSYLAIKRVLRCNPLSKGGVDLVVK